MKIGILTQPLNNNYGGILQNYALQTILTNQGHYVKTIDWDFNNTVKEYNGLSGFILRTKIFFLRLIGKKINTISTRKRICEILSTNNNQFINDHISRSRKLWGYKDFRKNVLEEEYDAIIVGSDQTWRPCYNGNGMLYRMFLDFTEGLQIKRVAYACSFGVSSWEYNKVETARCKALLADFDAISVRESTGIELIKNHLGNNRAVQVLDPTLLLCREDYISLISKNGRSQGGLLTYILDENPTITERINLVADALKLNRFSVLPQECPIVSIPESDAKEYISPSVDVWIESFAKADYVICDSFHGTVFSIIFNKPFVVIGNKERGLARFESILAPLNLSDRLVDEGSNNYLNVLRKQINWEDVNKTLAYKRKESIDFLINSIRENE